MPPKQRGQNLRGRNKLFRHDINSVRLGVGHAVIGRHTVTLLVDRLEPGTVRPSDCAVRMELGDLSLSHRSRDFGALRYDLDSLCVTRDVLLHYQQRVAKRLLAALQAVEAEAYAAHLNLVIAFARDLKRQFTPYFELFARGLLRGLYDRSGEHLQANTERVQLVFVALQAIALEVAAAWAPEAEGGEPTVASAIESAPPAAALRMAAIIVEITMTDAKEFVRRLGAELLATLCRRYGPYLPAVVGAFREAVAREGAAGAEPTGEISEDEDADVDVTPADAATPDAADGDTDSDDSAAGEDGALDGPFGASMSFAADGLSMFLQELVCGIAGTLHTRFEELLAAALDALAATDAQPSPLQAELTWLAVSRAFGGLVESVRKDVSGAAAVRILEALHRELPGRDAHLFLRALKSVLAAGPHALCNAAAPAIGPAVAACIGACAELVKRAAAQADVAAPRILAAALAAVVPLVITTAYNGAAALERGQRWAAQVLAETGRCAHRLLAADVARDATQTVLLRFTQDVTQKSVAHATNAGMAHAAVSAFDEFVVATATMLTYACGFDGTSARSGSDAALTFLELAASCPASGSAGMSLLHRLAAHPRPIQLARAGPKAPGQTIAQWSVAWAAATAKALTAALQGPSKAGSAPADTAPLLHRLTLWARLLPELDRGPAPTGMQHIAATLPAVQQALLDTSAADQQLLLEYFVTAAAATTAGSTQDDSAVLGGTLHTLIERLVNAVPAVYRLLPEGRALTDANVAEAAAAQISHHSGADSATLVLLATLERLQTTKAHADGAQGQWLRALFPDTTHPSYRRFVALLMHTLAATRVPSGRLASLRLLRDAYEYERSLAVNGAHCDAFPVLTAEALAYDREVMDVLLRSEEADPLSGEFDLKTTVLTKLVFEAGNTTHFLARYQHQSQCFMVQLVAKFFVGAFHIKFAPLWGIAVRVLVNLVRGEIAHAALAEEPARKAPSALWADVVRPHVALWVLSNGVSADRDGQDAEAQAPTGNNGPVVDACFPLRFDDAQLHFTGALVSRTHRVFAAADPAAHVVHRLPEGAQLTIEHCSHSASGDGAATDTTTVTRSFLSVFQALAQPLATAAAPAKISGPSLHEEFLLRLAAFDAGLGEGGRRNLRALGHRIEVTMLAMAAACASWPRDALSAARRAALESVFQAYTTSSDSRTQAAAVEGLWRIGVAPYATYHEKLFPILGGRVQIAPLAKAAQDTKLTVGMKGEKRLGTANAKSALTFLQTFDFLAEVREEHRGDFLAALVLLCLPTLTSTGRAGSGGASHRKVRDREVLGRKVFALLQLLPHAASPAGDVLASVLQTVFVRILHLAEPASTDLIQRVVGCARSGEPDGEATTSLSRLRRHYEKAIRDTHSALRLLQQLVATIGARMGAYAVTCVEIVLQAYRLSTPANVAEAAGLAPHLRLQAVPGTCTAIRKQAAALLVAVLDAHPEEGAAALSSTHTRTLLLAVAEDLLTANSRAGVDASGSRGGATAVLPSPVRLLQVLTAHRELVPFCASHYGALAVRTARTFLTTRASDAAILGVLGAIGALVAAADDIIRGPPKGTVRTAFLEPNSDGLFEALHALVTAAAETVVTSTKGQATAIPPRVWKDVMLLATALPAFFPTAAGRSEGRLAQLLEIALQFARSPLCATERASAEMAADVILVISQRIAVIDPRTHFRRLVALFNVVTAPKARLALCGALAAAVTKIAGVGAEAVLQLQAAARAAAGLNAFRAVAETADDDDEPRKGAGTKRAREAAVADTVDYSQYDHERRYHTFNAISTFFSGGTTRKGKRNVLTQKEGASADCVRRERAFDGDEDVALDVVPEQRLVCGAVSIVCANVLFFLRDHERTIRTFASEALAAIVRYLSLYPNPADGGSEAVSGGPLDAVIRPMILPTLRRGVTSKDAQVRVEHMRGFGAIAKHFPLLFPSLHVLYSQHSEADFYACIGSPQHRVRMNALASLRRRCGEMNQREVLRVFVPFILTFLKDHAQGRKDPFSEQVSEARAKGFVDSLLATIAAIAAHMPWEGYYQILKALLHEASANDAVRPVMLKGIVQTLENFHFYTTDPDTQERRALAEAPAADAPTGADQGAADSDDDEEATGDADETVQTAREARAARKSVRIAQTLEDEVLPTLYGFILTKKRAPRNKELEGVLNESGKAGTGQDGPKTETRASVMLPVAIGILKVIRMLPSDRFDHHVDLLLGEVVIKLRTKQDKQRETARKVLCSMMNECGPSKLRFVVSRLRDNLVHGYQLHVLGYTLVSLLQSMFGFAGEKPTPQVEAAAEPPQPADDAASDAAADSSSDDDDDDAEGKDDSKKTDNSPAQEKPTKAPSSKFKAGVIGGPADEAAAVAKAMRMGGSRRRIFDVAESAAALDNVLPLLFDIFLDDYLGETGEQKEQVELMSTMLEVKRNKSLQGFSFLAAHCSATTVLALFSEKVRWLLAPPTSRELFKHTAGSGHVLGDNTKYLHGDKNRAADARFVERVRVLAVRVTKALITNQRLDLGESLAQSLAMITRNNTVREAKIAEFEAKDGTRRIRGNIDSHTAARVLSQKEQYEKNYAVAQRPERIDVDFSSHTVLATQHKQKLRVYRGRYAKELAAASKGFREADHDTAVVLDVFDEFNLKFLLLILKRAMGVGRTAAVKAAAAQRLVTEAPEVAEAPDDGQDGQDPDDEAAEGVEEGLEPAAPAEDGAFDEWEEFERRQQEQTLDEGRAVRTAQRDARKAAAAERRDDAFSKIFGSEYRAVLSDLLAPVLAVLQGEGADTVITTGFDVLQALLALQPPLASVKTAGPSLFDVLAELLERGAIVKHRSMRVLSTLVQHPHFTLAKDQAAWLVKVARGEIIERSTFLSGGLGLLLAVIAQRCELEEVYALIDPVTELMLHRATAQALRTRCVSIIAKFLTEYPLTMSKLRSHLDMYVQNLQFPAVDGRMAILELLGVLAYRLPQEVLRGECSVLFIPLAHCMSASPWAPCQERAASVLQALIANAGLDVVAPVITTWLQAESLATRQLGAQCLAVIIPVVPRLYALGEESATMTADERGVRFESLRAATLWCVPEIQRAILYEHPLTKRRVAALREEVAASAKSGRVAEATLQAAVTARVRAERDLGGWTVHFFALRALEALLQQSQLFAGEVLGGENAPVMEHILASHLRHSHPWVRNAAMRVVRTYLDHHALAATPLGTVHTLVAPAATAAEPDLLCLPAGPSEGEVAATPEQVAAVCEQAKRTCQLVLQAIAASDVRDELHYGYRAMDDPQRGTVVALAASLMHLVAVCGVLLGSADAYAALWRQVTSMLAPIVAARTPRGYLVSTASLAEIVHRAIAACPFPAGAGAVQPARAIGADTMLHTIVPFLAVCAQSHDLSHRLEEIGAEAIPAVREVIAAHGTAFEASGQTPKRHRKERATAAAQTVATDDLQEGDNGSDRTVSEQVVFALATITEELREKNRAEKQRQLHEKQARKAQRREAAAPIRERLARKLTGGKKRSRYA